MPRIRSFYLRHEWCVLRAQVLAEMGSYCGFCGADEEPEVDHIQPLSIYPELAFVRENLQVLCGPCNRRKRDFDPGKPRPGAVQREKPTVDFSKALLEATALSGSPGTKRIKNDAFFFVSARVMSHSKLRIIPGSYSTCARIGKRTVKGTAIPIELINKAQ